MARSIIASVLASSGSRTAVPLPREPDVTVRVYEARHDPTTIHERPGVARSMKSDAPVDDVQIDCLVVREHNTAYMPHD